jgi:hypothetical protein
MRANSSAADASARRLAASVARRNAIRRSSISCARGGSAAISARRLASVLNSMCGSSCDCSRVQPRERGRVRGGGDLRALRARLAARM